MVAEGAVRVRATQGGAERLVSAGDVITITADGLFIPPLDASPPAGWVGGRWFPAYGAEPAHLSAQVASTGDYRSLVIAGSAIAPGPPSWQASTALELDLPLVPAGHIVTVLVLCTVGHAPAATDHHVAVSILAERNTPLLAVPGWRRVRIQRADLKLADGMDAIEIRKVVITAEPAVDLRLARIAITH
jgi:hypothetical protein